MEIPNFHIKNSTSTKNDNSHSYTENKAKNKQTKQNKQTNKKHHSGEFHVFTTGKKMINFLGNPYEKKKKKKKVGKIQVCDSHVFLGVVFKFWDSPFKFVNNL